MGILDLVGLGDTEDITKGLLGVAGVAVVAILISGKGKTLGESFSSGLTGIGTGTGSLLGNIGEGFGRGAVGFAEGFSAVTSAIGGAFRGAVNVAESFSNFSSAHQRNLQTTYNMRTIQFIREGRLQ